MALELKASTTQKSDGTEIYIEVVDATGVYDVDTNPGGFNAPNPIRNTLAIVIYGVHKTSTEDVELEFLPYSATTVESFTLAMEEALNGHSELTITALPIFDDEEDYEDDDVVYDNENPAAPFIKKMVDDEWVTLTPAELAEETETTKLVENIFPVPQAKEFMDELNAAKLKKLRAFNNQECIKDDYEDLRDRYEYVKDLLIAATDGDFCSGVYNEAQLKIEEIFAYKEKING